MCLWIINYQSGEIVSQPIIQLFGFDSIYNENILVNEKHKWPISQGLFKIYVQLVPGENIIQLSTLTSELSFTLIYCPLKTNKITLRLIYISYSDEIDPNVKRICKQFFFLTKLVRSTFDEILYKQIRHKRTFLFNIEQQIHHVSMSKIDFENKINNEDVFKEIYRQIHRTDLINDSSIKIIIYSAIAPLLKFAYTFKNVIVFNLPNEFIHLPATFDEFYEILHTIKNESLFYSIGAYLHELGHLFGLDHGISENDTIMSTSKHFIASGKDFFLVSSRFTSILYNRQCLCYTEPRLNLSCSYSNGLLYKNSIYLKSSCKSDIHCQFSLKFNNSKCDTNPKECACIGQFQFEIDHCYRLKNYFNNEET